MQLVTWLVDRQNCQKSWTETVREEAWKKNQTHLPNFIGVQACVQEKSTGYGLQNIPKHLWSLEISKTKRIHSRLIKLSLNVFHKITDLQAISCQLSNKWSYTQVKWNHWDTSGDTQSPITSQTFANVQTCLTQTTKQNLETKYVIFLQNSILEHLTHIIVQKNCLKYCLRWYFILLHNPRHPFLRFGCISLRQISNPQTCSKITWVSRALEPWRKWRWNLCFTETRAKFSLFTAAALKSVSRPGGRSV